MRGNQWRQSVEAISGREIAPALDEGGNQWRQSEAISEIAPAPPSIRTRDDRTLLAAAPRAAAGARGTAREPTRPACNEGGNQRLISAHQGNCARAHATCMQ